MKTLFSLTLFALAFMVNAQCNIDIQWTSSINGGNITFNNVSTGVPSNPAFAWLYDGQSSSMENPTFPYNALETQVCFAITDLDSTACQDSICGPLNTDSCFLDISWTSVIAGGNITFTNTSTGMPLNPAFAWLYDGQGSSVENPTFTYNPAATDVCFAIYDIDNPSCEDSICGPAMDDSCDVDLSWTSSISGGNITFTNTSTGMPSSVSFAWLYNGQGSSMENPTFPYNDSITQVCFAINDLTGANCEDSICGPLNSDSTMYLLESREVTNFKLFPNPAADEINILLDDYQSSYEIRIMDLTGRQVYVLTLNDQITTIDISALDQGGYLIFLIDAEKPDASRVEKFLKQ